MGYRVALRSQISRYALKTSGNLNKKTKNFLAEDCLLSPINIVSTSPVNIQIEDFSLSTNGILVNVDSLNYTFDANELSDPYYVYLRCENPFNHPFYVAYNYDASSVYMSTYGAAENITVSDKRVEGVASISYNKNNSEAEAGISLELSIDISNYDGIGAKVFIPTGDSSSIEMISVIVDESGDLSNHTRYDMTSGMVDGWNTLIGKFNNPSSSSGTNTLQASARTIVLIKTTPSTETISGILIDNLFGYFDDPNMKTYDDTIDFYISDSTTNDFLISTFTGGSWYFRDHIGIASSAESFFPHQDSTSIHIPEGIMDVIVKSKLSTTDTAITIGDATGATTDYDAAHESTLKSISRTIAEPRIGTLSPYDSKYLKAEYMRKNLFSGHDNGIHGYIDDGLTTATIGYGCYFGGGSATTINTEEFLDIPGLVHEIIVDAPSLKDSALPEITYDLWMNGNEIDTDLPLNVSRDTSGEYATYSMTGTQMKLIFNIPAGSGGDYWTSKNTHPVASKANRIISVSDRFMLAAVEDSLYNYMVASDIWRSLTSQSNSIPHSNPHPASRVDGIRSIPTIESSGETYNISTNTWTALHNGSAPNGRPVDIGLNEFYNIDSTATTRFLDSANCYLNKTGRADDWVSGASFNSHNGEMITHGGSITASYTDLVKKFTFNTDAWTSGVASASSQAYQAYAQLSTKKTHSICGKSDSTTYIKINEEYNLTNATFTSKTDAATELMSPGAGLTQLDTILMMGGENASQVDVNSVSEYTPDIICKFFGFAVKLKYSTLFGDADHVGYWADDTANFFTEADSTEKDVTGYWTNESGMIGDGTGTYWGHFAYWADDTATDYSSSEDLYTISTTGYWTDSSGLLDGDPGCLWNDEDY